MGGKQRRPRPRPNSPIDPGILPDVRVSIHAPRWPNIMMLSLVRIASTCCELCPTSARPADRIMRCSSTSTLFAMPSRGPITSSPNRSTSFAPRNQAATWELAPRNARVLRPISATFCKLTTACCYFRIQMKPGSESEVVRLWEICPCLHWSRSCGDRGRGGWKLWKSRAWAATAAKLGRNTTQFGSRRVSPSKKLSLQHTISILFYFIVPEFHG